MFAKFVVSVVFTNFGPSAQAEKAMLKIGQDLHILPRIINGRVGLWPAVLSFAFC